MQNLLKISVALLAAIAAFVANWLYLNSRETTTALAQINKPLTVADDVFREEHFSKIELAVADGTRPQAVAWRDRYVLYGAPIRRDYRAGDLVFLSEVAELHRDLSLEEGEAALIVPLDRVAVERSLLRVGGEIGFVVMAEPADASPTSAPAAARPTIQLGPYRIVSVGARVDSLDPAESSVERDVDPDVETISVAIRPLDDGELDAQDGQLVRAIDADRVISVTMHRRQATSPRLQTAAAGATDGGTAPNMMGD